MHLKRLHTALILLLSLTLTMSANAQLTIQVGNGTGSNDQYSCPTPFEDYYDGDRQQFLFRASELTAAGMPAGAILSIAWDVKSKNGQANNNLIGWELKIFNTTTNDLSSGWATPIGTPTVVLSSGSTGNYNPTVGMNVFTLATPHTWNGTDNIVVEVCDGSASKTCGSYTRNCSVNYTNAGFTSSRYARLDCAGSYCNSPPNSGSYGYSNNRPNTIFGVGLPCIDTPKTTIVGPKQVCPNKAFTLRPADYYANAQFSWEYSTNGTTWSNFTGIPSTSGAIKDSITAPKWYRLTIKCNGNSYTYTTAPHKVSIAPFYYCYCDNSPEADTGANLGNLTIINSSQLDTIFSKAQLVTGTGLPVYNNINADNSYTSYHDSLAWPCMYRDSSFIYYISQIHKDNKFKTGVVQVFVDYNRDGLYDPNNERILVHALDGNDIPQYAYKSSVTVPSTAKTGPTGLRLVLSEDTLAASPCGFFPGAGEVEDYIIEICDRPCDSAVNAGTVLSTDTSMCGGYEYRLTDTTYEQNRSGFSRAWQVSGDLQTWMNLANSLNKDTLERVFANQPLHYRLRTICTNTNDTNYSAPLLINVKPSYKCYCYSKAIGGKGVDTSDIGGVTIADYTSNAGGPHLLNKAAVLPRTDFTDITPIELFTDSLYKFYVYHTMPVQEHGDAKITIFMDFNNNHEYDIPDERIYTGFTTIGNHTLIDNVIIPYNAITDVPTGMRVIVNNDVGPNVPSDEGCGGYVSGETEDYILIFRRKWAENINETMKLGGFSVHPNPTSGKFYVQFSTNSEISEVNVRVTGITGQLIQEHSYEHKGGMFYQELDMSGQSAGVYFVELNADGQKLMKKLIVQ